MHITQLPSEIISQILEQLSKETLCQCLYVCKSLSAEAMRLCYSTTVLSNNHTAFLNTVMNRGIGDYVRALTFSFESRGGLDQNRFELLMAHLPQLASIQFEFMSCISAYLKYLMSVPLESMTSLQQISIPSTTILKPSVYTRYLSITQRLRSQITALCLDNFRVPYFDSRASNVFTFLSQFPNLKSLTISNTLRSGVHGINMISVLSVCNHLTHLDLTSEFPDMDELPAFIRQNTSLESLKLNVQDLTQLNIDYLLNTSPKRLHIQTSSRGLDQWLETKSQDYLQKWIQFINNVKSVKLQMTAKDGDSERTYGTSSAWHFIHQLYHDKCNYTLTVLLSNTTRCFHMIHRTRTTLDVQLCMPYECSNQIDVSFVNEISITNYLQHAENTSFMETALMKIMHGCDKERLTSIKLHDGTRSLCIGPSKKSSSRDTTVTLKRFNIEDPILNVIGNLYPNTKTLIFTLCHIEQQEKYKYSVVLDTFTNLELVRIHLDKISNLDQFFFVEVNYMFHSTLYYQCLPNKVNQCDGALVREAEKTVIISIQCAAGMIDQLVFKSKIGDESYAHQIWLPYPDDH